MTFAMWIEYEEVAFRHIGSNHVGVWGSISSDSVNQYECLWIKKKNFGSRRGLDPEELMDQEEVWIQKIIP